MMLALVLPVMFFVSFGLNNSYVPSESRAR